MNFLIAPIKLIKQAIEAQEFQENHENEVRSLAEGERRCNEKKFSDLNRTLATERAEANKLRSRIENLERELRNAGRHASQSVPARPTNSRQMLPSSNLSENVPPLGSSFFRNGLAAPGGVNAPGSFRRSSLGGPPPASPSLTRNASLAPSPRNPAGTPGKQQYCQQSPQERGRRQDGLRSPQATPQRTSALARPPLSSERGARLVGTTPQETSNYRHRTQASAVPVQPGASTACIPPSPATYAKSYQEVMNGSQVLRTPQRGQKRPEPSTPQQNSIKLANSSPQIRSQHVPYSSSKRQMALSPTSGLSTPSARHSGRI
eukprot:CAMPEP_0172582754 /NCGR_PEP_ID=MMETSP1068-20121228/2280_1 /TAXON_ID=35684 /ORGANISM="Pseudopedinella elastica, Strain CCMP716" /LENGTH=318 /DNA_ID=CAMNT_0013376273 /DNA_START=219 /DNA_END=1175 /DNA_ORIENTATION=-